MGERDPFGREHDEDPLAGIGWRAPAEPGAAAAEAGPAAAVEEAEPEPAAPEQGDPGAWAPVLTPRRFNARRAASLVIRLAVVAAAVVAIASVAMRVGGTIDESLDAARPSDALPQPAAPVGLGPESYLRPDNFRTALARMRGEGRVQSVRLEPERISARLVSTKRRVVWNLRAGREPQRVVGPPYYDFNTTIAFSQIDPDAPARFARAAAGRARRSVDDVDFLFIQRNVGRARWVLYFKGGDHYTADRHGRHVERG